ncbi:MAG TPA: PD-(D/E)XK nuclease family protein [Candidatus Absconditabacterales bacterium]|nr:PD-(D/E)XK nuclease family protein [Candidatus Absconditabacterales bacterium]HMT27365.1 PD-(D/E)XK nuclease family protein [Candidatus Absconditabacterales bacterium]
MSKYSHSRISTYEKCPLQFRFRYIDGYAKGMSEDSLILSLGKAVHSALEQLYKKIKILVIPKKEEVLSWFDQIRKKELSSFTTQYDEQTQKDFQLRGVIYIQEFYEKYYPFNQSRPSALEEKIMIQLMDGVHFSGVVDRIDFKDDTLYVIDYKTGSSIPTNSQDSAKNQLLIYGLAMQSRYEGKYKKMIGKVIYLHFSKEVEFEMTPEMIEEVKDYYSKKVREIQEKSDRYFGGQGDKEAFEAIVGRQCDSCPFKEICPKRKHQYLSEEIVINDLTPKTLKSFVDQYAKASKQATEAEKNKKYLRELLIQYAESGGFSVLFGEENQITLSKSNLLKIDKEKENELKQLLQKENLRDEVSTLNNTLLQKKIKDGTLKREEIADLLREEISYRLGVKQKKDDN